MVIVNPKYRQNGYVIGGFKGKGIFGPLAGLKNLPKGQIFGSDPIQVDLILRIVLSFENKKPDQIFDLSITGLRIRPIS